MELQQLQYFLVAAQYEHITKAANSLHIAQPALSQSIKRLESELGVKLFDRKKGGIILSDSGRLLVEELKPIMKSLDSLPKKLADTAKKQHQTIHLNVLAASVLVTNCIIAYKAQHPDVNFHFLQSQFSMDYDLCITAALPRKNPAANQVVLEEKFFLAVPANSKYARYKEIQLEEVSEEGFIVMADTRPIRSICDQFCLEAGFSPDIVFESMNFESVRSLISAGLGVGFWPEYSWESAEHSQNMVLLPIKSPECKRDIIITYNQQFSENRIVKDFYDFLIEFAMDCKEKHQKSREANR
ncbi:MAG: LysR family transcriptional regulator [Lachnospiraceae bacterium]|nr:LysR family transcriptional regulator [Lachnospiraceae bacterium]